MFGIDRKIILLLIYLFISNVLYAQIDIKRDDFVGSYLRNWWDTRDDGIGIPLPAYKDGYISFVLINPDENYKPWTDCEIFDGYPNPGGPWDDVSVTLRAKMMNDHKDGSHGWGIWYTEWPVVVQDQAFFMRVRDKDDPTAYNFLDMEWFRADITNSKCEVNHAYTELDDGVSPDVNDLEWHTYKIVRGTKLSGDRYVEMFVDGEQVFYSDDQSRVPNQSLAFHIWIDNFIYDPYDCEIYTYRRSWSGSSEMVMDYVQIMTPDGQLDKSESASGIKLLRQVPNEIYSNEIAELWKSYSFTSPGATCVAIMTARVEQYLDENTNELSDDDDIRFIYNGTDYGWNTDQSFSGDAEGTVSRTKILQQYIAPGSANIDVYGETSPLLYDVTVLGSDAGGIIFNQEFNETFAGGDSLWKEINFQTWGGEVAVYVSASADEDPAPSPSHHYGYQYSEYDSDDDDIRIQLDNYSFGYRNDASFWGNRQFGEPKSILVSENLSQGSHTLRLYAHGSPTLHRVFIYGENDDTSLPVSLIHFEAYQTEYGIQLNWKTASEVNNLGFNIYRRSAENSESNIKFTKVNEQLIPGAGNRSSEKFYSFIDKEPLIPGKYYYTLEDVDFSGRVQRHDTINVSVSENFSSNLPTTFEVQTYPNPFNSSVKIRISLPNAVNLKMILRDIGGRAVKALYDGWTDQGIFELSWDSMNDRGQVVSSGVYFLQIDIDDKFHLQRKLLLIR